MSYNSSNLVDCFKNLKQLNKDVNGFNFEGDDIIIFLNKASNNTDNIPKSLTLQNKAYNTKFKKLEFNLTSGPCSPYTSTPLASIPIGTSSYQNRTQLSVVSGGCGISVWSLLTSSQAPEIGSMTLGGVFKDSLDGSLVGVTVSHNLFKEETATLDATVIGTGETRLQAIQIPIPFIPLWYVPMLATEKFIETPNFYGYTTNYVEKVYQFDVSDINLYHSILPNTMPNTNTDNSPFCLGRVKRATALSPYLPDDVLYLNDLDVCVISLNGNMVDKTSRNIIGMPSSIQPDQVEFCTQEELFTVLNTVDDPASPDFGKSRLFWSAHLSGPQGRDTGTDCFYRLDAFINTIQGYTYLKPAEKVNEVKNEGASDASYVFSDVFQFVRDLSYEPQSNRTQDSVVLPGDSGSLLWVKTYSEREWKLGGIIIGSVEINLEEPLEDVLLANGTPQTRILGGIFVPFWKIAEKYKIEPWNDDVVNIVYEKPYSLILDNDIPTSKTILDFENFTSREEIVHNIEIDNKTAFYSGPAFTKYRNIVSYKY